jgi:O-antigen/teichoic acid export membrane protein
LLGDWALKIYAGHEFETSLSVLVALAAMAAFYLLSETVSQGLFALGCGRLAALGWFVGMLACAVCLIILGVGVVERVSYSLVLGTFVAAVVQAAFYLAMRGRE